MFSVLNKHWLCLLIFGVILILPRDNGEMLYRSDKSKVSSSISAPAREHLVTRSAKTRLRRALPLDKAGVDILLQQADTERFLAQFNNSKREVVETQIRSCPYTDLCGFSFLLKQNDFRQQTSCCKECLCDYPECMANRSCCPDIIPADFFTAFESTPFLNSGSNANDDLSNSDMWTAGTPKEKIDYLYEATNNVSLQCTLQHAKIIADIFENQKSCYMYATCPSATDSALKMKCEQTYSFENINGIDDMVPVTVGPNLYRNKHCAECNNAESDFIPWKVMLTYLDIGKTVAGTNEMSFLQFFFNTNVFDISFAAPDTRYEQPECTTVIDRCNVTGKWSKYDPFLEGKCSLYDNIITITDSVYYRYKNIFCAQCNGEKVGEFICEMGQSTEADSYPFSGLLAFSPLKAENQEDNIKESQQCVNPHDIYDHVLNECSPLYCSKIHYLQGAECQRVFTFATSLYYDVHFRLSPVSQLQIGDVYAHMERLELTLIGHIFDQEEIEYQSFCYSLVYFTLDRGGDALSSPIRYIHFIFRIGIKELHDPYAIGDLFNSNNGDKITAHVGVGAVNFEIRVIGDASLEFPLFIRSPDKTITQDMHFEPWVMPMLEMANFAKLDAFQQTILPYQTRATLTECPYQANFINFASVRDCPTVILFRDNVEWVEINGGVYLPDYSATIQFKDFYFQTLTELHICKTAFQQAQAKSQDVVLAKHTHNISIEATVSIACISVSLICLLITIFVFMNLPPLRTLPGLNTMALSVSLFIAQSLYLVSSFGRLEQKSAACVSVGILLHFFSLLSIFWMNICTFHIFRVLTATKVMSQNYRRKYALFHMFAMTMSLLFVGVCISTSIYLSGGSDVGYGSVTCYFSSALMLRYTFVLPVFAVVLMNFFMFGYVIIKFERTPDIIKNGMRNDRNEFIIFIKLSSLTGVTWIFGVLYSWFNIEALSYIFILLNASQGAFVMVSFVLNRRVVRLGKIRLSESWSQRFSDSARSRRSTSGTY